MSKTRKPISRDIIQLLDRAGRPARGIITDPKHPKCGEEAVVIAYAKARYAHPSNYSTPPKTLPLRRRAMMRFDPENKDAWIEARYVEVRRRDENDERITLTRALATMSHKSWWMNVDGALERRTTVYEERMGVEFAPRPGWTLVSSETVTSLIAHSKLTTGVVLSTAETETEAAHKEKERMRSHARALDEAQRTLAKHERGLERSKKLVKYWRTRVDVLAGRIAR